MSGIEPHAQPDRCALADTSASNGRVTRRKQNLWRSGRIIIALILTIGIFLRFVGLDTKPYTTDEVRTLLRSSGYTSQDLYRQVFNGTIIQARDIEKYQTIGPERTDADVIKSLEGEDVHPPLYFMMLRYWMKWLGHSPFITRSLAVSLSILALPLIYWLCLELFGSQLVGWTAVTLATISPFHLINSQETRPYSLWTVGILLSCIFLFRALKSKGYLNWVAYSLAFTLSIYAHVNFAFVAAGQAIYAATMERLRITKKLVAFVLACFIACLTFVPWLLVVLANWGTIKQLTGWLTSLKMSFLERVWAIIFNLNALFLDLNYEFLPRNPVPYLFVALIGYALYFLCKTAPKRTWLLVICLIAVPALSQMIPDFISGGRRTVFARYLTPSYLGIQLAVAYLLAMKATEVKTTLRSRRLWKFCLATIVSLGILSCATIAQASSGRTQGITPVMHLQIAQVVNQSDRPLLISGHMYSRILSLNNLLKPETHLQVFSDKKTGDLPQQLESSNSLTQFDNVFLYLPSKDLLEEIEQKRNYTVQAIIRQPENQRLWLAKVEKPAS